MRSREATPKYASEAELCAQFIEYASSVGWVSYAETAGWDVLLVRKTDGYQIGVQAKMQANLEVLQQATAHEGPYSESGPDFRAVLVPAYGGKVHSLQEFTPYVGVTLIAAAGPGKLYRGNWVRLGYGEQQCFRPGLPHEPKHAHEFVDAGHWFERCPAKRHRLPEYVPDVPAGVAAPVQLTSWKIGAMRIAVLLDRHGFVTRADFKSMGIDHRRWIASGPASWLVPDPPRGFKRRDGATSDSWRKEHPRVFAEIEADFEKWAPKCPHLLVGSAA